MNKDVKYHSLSILIALLIFLVVYFICSLTFLDMKYSLIIASVVSILLSPRVKTYETQSGIKTQIKWLGKLRNW